MRSVLLLSAPAVLGSVRLLSAAFRGLLAEWRLPDERIALLDLVLVEATTNVVRHAYRDRSPGTVEVALGKEGCTLELTIRDQGEPFDPTAVLPPPEPDPADPSTWPDGGMGLPIIRSACQRLAYRSDGETNSLTLTFSLVEPPS